MAQASLEVGQRQSYTQFLLVEEDSVPAIDGIQKQLDDDFVIVEKATTEAFSNFFNGFFSFKPSNHRQLAFRVLDQDYQIPNRISEAIKVDLRQVQDCILKEELFFNAANAQEVIEIRDKLRRMFPNSQRSFVVEQRKDAKGNVCLCLLIINMTTKEKIQIASANYQNNNKDDLVESEIAQLPRLTPEEEELFKLINDSEKVDGESEHWKYYLKDVRLQFDVEACVKEIEKLKKSGKPIDYRLTSIVLLSCRINSFEAKNNRFQFSEVQKVDVNESQSIEAIPQQYISEPQEIADDSDFRRSINPKTGETVAHVTRTNEQPVVSSTSSDRLLGISCVTRLDDAETKANDVTVPHPEAQLFPQITFLRREPLYINLPIPLPRIGLLILYNNQYSRQLTCGSCGFSAAEGEQVIYSVHKDYCNPYHRGPTSYVALVSNIKGLNIPAERVRYFLKLKCFHEAIVDTVGMKRIFG